MLCKKGPRLGIHSVQGPLCVFPAPHGCPLPQLPYVQRGERLPHRADSIPGGFILVHDTQGQEPWAWFLPEGNGGEWRN